MPAPARARIYPGVASVESAGSANFQVGKRARPQRCHDTPQAYYGPKLRPAHQVGRVRRANLRFAMLYASGYVDVSADNLGRACEQLIASVHMRSHNGTDVRDGRPVEPNYSCSILGEPDAGRQVGKMSRGRDRKDARRAILDCCKAS